jgi:hypothetical protein
MPGMDGLFGAEVLKCINDFLGDERLRRYFDIEARVRRFSKEASGAPGGYLG